MPSHKYILSILLILGCLGGIYFFFKNETVSDSGIVNSEIIESTGSSSSIESINRSYLLNAKEHKGYSGISDGKGKIGTGNIQRLGGSNMTPVFQNTYVVGELTISRLVLFGSEDSALSSKNVSVRIINPTLGGSIPLLFTTIGDEGKVVHVSMGWIPNEIDFDSTEELILEIVFKDGKNQIVHFPVEVKKDFIVMKQEFTGGTYEYSNKDFRMNLYFYPNTKSAPEECRLPEFSNELLDIDNYKAKAAFELHYQEMNTPEMKKKRDFIEKNRYHCLDLVLQQEKVFGSIVQKGTRTGPIQGEFTAYSTNPAISVQFLENIQDKETN